jgi:hypothetical protein
MSQEETRMGTDSKQHVAETVNEDISRRDFLKTVAVTTAAAGVAGSATSLMAAPAVDRQAMIAALGDTLIPSDPGDPGYKDLVPYKITEEVLKALPGVSDADLELLNGRTKEKFGGKTFLELDEPKRAQYLHQIMDGSAASDAKELQTLQRVYRNTRRRILTLYYSNFPEHEWPRDKNGVPILKPGDVHQITNPNTKQLITAWDQVGFSGPLTWEDEERRRNFVKKIHWHENWSPMEYRPETPQKK